MVLILLLKDKSLKINGVGGKATFLYFINGKVENRGIKIILINKKINNNSNLLYFINRIKKKKRYFISINRRKNK